MSARRQVPPHYRLCPTFLGFLDRVDCSMKLPPRYLGPVRHSSGLADLVNSTLHIGAYFTITASLHHKAAPNSTKRVRPCSCGPALFVLQSVDLKSARRRSSPALIGRKAPQRHSCGTPHGHHVAGALVRRLACHQPPRPAMALHGCHCRNFPAPAGGGVVRRSS